MSTSLTDTMQIKSILKDAVAKKATDVHILNGLPVMFRLAGELVPSNDTALGAQATKKLCYSLLSEEQVTAFERDLDLCFAIRR